MIAPKHTGVSREHALHALRYLCGMYTRAELNRQMGLPERSLSGMSRAARTAAAVSRHDADVNRAFRQTLAALEREVNTHGFAEPWQLPWSVDN